MANVISTVIGSMVITDMQLSYLYASKLFVGALQQQFMVVKAGG